MAMKTLLNEHLAPYTSLQVGGPAEKLVITESLDEMVKALSSCSDRPFILGYGCNALISDDGLAGTTIVWRGGEIVTDGTSLIADAGAWWDDAVKTAIKNELWGLELTSEIPSSVGGAVYGNIAAYGQQVSSALAWVDVYDFSDHTVKNLTKDNFKFDYRWSSLQDNPNHIILRAGFELSRSPLGKLSYDSALAIAEELNLNPSDLNDCREIIIETRRRAGSIYHPWDKSSERTAGSFFKNPIVSTKQATELAKFDESGKTLERIQHQSQVHGGDSHRASAAHVLLAAGFQRGQTWDKVRLHKDHVLKIETIEGATATEVFEVVQEITKTVQEKLGITLEPEVKFLGF